MRMPGKKILIIDDDRELADGLRLVLERQGHRVMWCRNGADGKEAIYREPPDLVLIDMMMQRMGGFPVLEHFRDKPDAPPFIMMTANEGSRHKAYAEYLGVRDYVRKPFAIERMMESIDAVFNNQSPIDPNPGE
jgi:DNA-binding response OmpR family regulator